MDEEAEALARRRLEAKIEEVRKGNMREYWLELYIRDNFKQLGFSEMSDPHETGYDFVGVKDGKKVVIEAERTPKCFLNHHHNKDKVDILIAMAYDETPRELLPKTVIIVDPEDLVRKTYEARKSYAINVAPITQARREAKQKALRDPATLMWMQLARTLRSLHEFFFEEEVYEGTPEGDSMSEAAETVAAWYIGHYDLCKALEKEECRPIPEILLIWNRIYKNGIDNLSEEDRAHLMLWLGLIRDEYVKKL